MSDTQQIKDKLDIVDFIGEYVQLKPAGVNRKGLCPFHQEKSPSFMVNRERQSWHCFGCSKGGDIFSFLQEIEGMDFVDALKFLADRAGIQLSRQPSGANTSQKNRIKTINGEAARFYHNFLTKMDQSKAAREYLVGRGLSNETIETWQIGFVPEQWDLLTKYLLKKGHSIDDLVAAGLTIKREGANATSGKGFYDRFRGRIMFPIRDEHDNVVGFTGRVLVETERSGGKYVNTPQTLVYDKSRVVFGLSKAKKAIRTQDNIVMVEGQVDVIAAHQAGFENVVATSGTALTEQQLALLKRYSDKMRMAFDADDAGVAAAKRGIALAVSLGMHVRVIQIPDGAGMDPDECIQRDPGVWKQAVEDAQDVMEWYIDRALVNRDLGNPKQKQAVVDEVLPEIAQIPYAVEKDHWIQKLSAIVSVDHQVLREDLKRFGAKRSDVRSATVEVREKKVEIVTKKQTRFEKLIERFLTLAFRAASFKDLDSIFKILDSLSTTESTYSPLYKALATQYNTGVHSIDIDALRNSVADSEQQENIVDILLMKGELDFSHTSPEEAQKELTSLSQQIENEWKKMQRQQLQQQIAIAEKQGDTEKLQALLQQFQSL